MKLSFHPFFDAPDKSISGAVLDKPTGAKEEKFEQAIDRINKKL